MDGLAVQRFIKFVFISLSETNEYGGLYITFWFNVNEPILVLFLFLGFVGDVNLCILAGSSFGFEGGTPGKRTS